jgi:hypothetical protein
MATYIASARSNYFKVKDAALFQKFCRQYGLEIIEPSPDAKNEERRYGFLIYDSLPAGRSDDSDGWIPTDFIQELAEQLAPGEVAVVMEVGSEKMRYLNGYACAVNSRGKTVELNLNQIYQQAKQRFGILPTTAEY